MAKIVVTNHVSLDGVMQSPASPDEDPRDGFQHGGWAFANNDEVMARKMGERMSRPGALLLGRRTYEHFYSYWPKQPDNPITDVLNRRQKYVVSRTLSEPLPWMNSTLVKGDEVAALKERSEEDLSVLGSGDLLRTLIREGLVDEYVLLIHPVMLGSGRRLFPDGAPVGLELVEVITTTTGVIIATYRTKETR